MAIRRTLTIEGKTVPFCVTGGTGRLYSRYFGKNWLKAMSSMLDSKGEMDAQNIDTTFFEEIAWCMAKQADSNIPDIDEWMDNTFSSPISFLESLEGIMNIFIAGVTPKTNPNPKKKNFNNKNRK